MRVVKYSDGRESDQTLVFLKPIIIAEYEKVQDTLAWSNVVIKPAHVVTRKGYSFQISYGNNVYTNKYMFSLTKKLLKKVLIKELKLVKGQYSIEKLYTNRARGELSSKCILHFEETVPQIIFDATFVFLRYHVEMV
jgi:hypothetical protein